MVAEEFANRSLCGGKRRETEEGLIYRGFHIISVEIIIFAVPQLSKAG